MVTLKKIPIKELLSGGQLEMPIFELVSPLPGPTVHIQANVHGAETQGSVVIYHLLRYLETHPFVGKFTLVPCANPIGINQKSGTFTKGRFNPISGENWNRNYLNLTEKYQKSLEQFIAQLQQEKLPWPIFKTRYQNFLASLLEEELRKAAKHGISDNIKMNYLLQQRAHLSDITLDLHTGQVACRYLYAPEYLKQQAAEFNFPYGIIIPHKFAGAMDEATFLPWVFLAEQLKISPLETNFCSYTLELGSEEIADGKAAEEDAKKILNFLGKRGALGENYCPFNFRPVTFFSNSLDQYLTYHAPMSGIVEYLKRPGESYQRGEVLCRFYHFHQYQNSSEELTSTLQAQEDGVLINLNPSSVIQQGMALLQILAK